MMTPAKLLPKEKAGSSRGRIPGGKSEQPLAVTDKISHGGRQGHRSWQGRKNGRQRKVFHDQFAINQTRAALLAPAHRAGLLLPNAEYMRFDSSFTTANHVYEKKQSRFAVSCASTSPAASGVR